MLGSVRRSDSPTSAKASTSRRAFLAGAGATVTAGLAGCLEQIRGGGSGEGGTVEIVSFPLDVDGVVFNYIDQEGILEEKLSDTGWDYRLNLSFEDIAPYVSNTAEIVGFSELEAAEIGVNEEIETTVFARRANAYFGWLVKVGSKWDPDNTGGVQETLDLIVEEGANIGIGGWGLGHVPADKLAFSEGFGYQMAEEGGDFNVVTAEIPAIPQLIDQGDLAIGANSPTHGAASRLMDDTLKPLFWDHDKVAEIGLGHPPLAGMGTRTSFYEENEEVVRRVFEAANEGYDWFFDEGLEAIPPDEDRRDTIGVQNEEQAEYAVRWQQHQEGVKHRTEAPPRPKDIGFSDEVISNAQDFLAAAVEVDFIPAGWEEYVDFVTL